MELKRRLNARTIFVIVAWLVVATYLWVGLQPAEASQYEVAGRLEIPGISLTSDVTEIALVGNQLPTPDTIVGSFSNHTNKTLLIGHSTTAFSGLEAIDLRQIIEYDGKTYRVVKIETLNKSHVSMNKILAGEERDTIVLMTCAGKLLPEHDATHRLIVTAVAE